MSVANVYVTGDGCLKIRDPVEENSGMYTCTVVNDVGAAMAMSHVTIISSDKMGLNMTQVSIVMFRRGQFYSRSSYSVVWILAKVLFSLNHGALWVITKYKV